MRAQEHTSDDLLFERASCGLAVLADDGTILRVNRTFLAWTAYDAAATAGKKRFQELLTTPGKIFYMTHIDPLLRMQGFVNEIACSLKCAQGGPIAVYLNFRIEKAADSSVLIHLSVFRGQDRAKYEEELRAAKRRAEQLSAIVQSSIDAIVSIDLEGKVLSANAGFETVFQYDPAEVIGRELSGLICSADHMTEYAEKLGHARSKQPLSTETRRTKRDGTPVHVSLSMSPIKNDFDEVIAISVIYRDITERVRAAEHIHHLMHEVNHRSKNLLAVVQGVARQTARNAPDLAAFIDRFSARLMAIAASQDLLVSRDWKGIQLQELVRSQLGHLGEDLESHVALHGHAIEINPRAAEAIGLALHELATNAVKYGALSREDGAVSLEWQIDMEQCVFSLTWTEEGGPAVTPPKANGFGSAVLGKMAPAAVHGTSTLSYDSQGVVYRLVAPVEQIVSR